MTVEPVASRLLLVAGAGLAPDEVVWISISSHFSQSCATHIQYLTCSTFFARSISMSNCPRHLPWLSAIA